MVHKQKAEASVLVIEEEGVPWYCDIMKFLELGVYPYGANKRELRLIRNGNAIHLMWRSAL